MKAILDKILIKREKEVDNLFIGEVLSVGNDVEEINKGDKILYGKFGLIQYKDYDIIIENQVILKQ